MRLRSIAAMCASCALVACSSTPKRVPPPEPAVIPDDAGGAVAVPHPSAGSLVVAQAAAPDRRPAQLSTHLAFAHEVDRSPGADLLLRDRDARGAGLAVAVAAVAAVERRKVADDVAIIGGVLADGTAIPEPDAIAHIHAALASGKRRIAYPSSMSEMADERGIRLDVGQMIVHGGAVPIGVSSLEAAATVALGRKPAPDVDTNAAALQVSDADRAAAAADVTRIRAGVGRLLSDLAASAAFSGSAKGLAEVALATARAAETAATGKQRFAARRQFQRAEMLARRANLLDRLLDVYRRGDAGVAEGALDSLVPTQTAGRGTAAVVAHAIAERTRVALVAEMRERPERFEPRLAYAVEHLGWVAALASVELLDAAPSARVDSDRARRLVDIAYGALENRSASSGETAREDARWQLAFDSLRLLRADAPAAINQAESASARAAQVEASRVLATLDRDALEIVTSSARRRCVRAIERGLSVRGSASPRARIHRRDGDEFVSIEPRSAALAYLDCSAAAQVWRWRGPAVPAAKPKTP